MTRSTTVQWRFNTKLHLVDRLTVADRKKITIKRKVGDQDHVDIIQEGNGFVDIRFAGDEWYSFCVRGSLFEEIMQVYNIGLDRKRCTETRDIWRWHNIYFEGFGDMERTVTNAARGIMNATPENRMILACQDKEWFVIKKSLPESEQ